MLQRLVRVYRLRSSQPFSMADLLLPSREDVVANYEHHLEMLQSVRQENNVPHKVTLVAVSKTKPTDYIKALYEHGCRHFGENYVQELEEKATQLKSACPDIKWHFIGHVQSNKAKQLASIPSLHLVQSVDSENLARKLDAALAMAAAGTEDVQKDTSGDEDEAKVTDRDGPLSVLIQVNTSGEESKGGVSTLPEVVALARTIADLKHLRCRGVMSIGEKGINNHEYISLRSVGDLLLSESLIDAPVESDEDDAPVIVSMGMSADWKEAVAHGSTCVRVGSAIFGARQKKT